QLTSQFASPFATGAGSSGTRTINTADGIADSDLKINARIIDGDESLIFSNETQTLNFNGAPAGNTFTITYGGITTQPIAYPSPFDPITGAQTLRQNIQNRLDA